MYVFFGAGKIGKRILSFCRWFGFEPDYFVDNNNEIEEVEGVKVITPKKALEMLDVIFMVTCLHKDSITEQLEELGVNRNNIVNANSEIVVYDYLMEQGRISYFNKRSFAHDAFSKEKVLFDLANGLALGGVETWSIQTARMLEEMGYETTLLVNSSKPKIMETDVDFLWANFGKGITDCMECILSSGAKYIVSNFVSSNFLAACVIKKIFGENIKLISVVHNDEEHYYEKYVQMQEYIDYCLTISNHIKIKLIDRGFPKDKIRDLRWEIPCEDALERVYSEETKPLKIGYAGRVVIEQKRMDIICAMVDQLADRGVDFFLEIAGTGNYLNELESQFRKKGLIKFVKMHGFIDNTKIHHFWKKQDIMISCSDYEGHSITQCEAMSEGVVPVITDVSGGRDDIVDGESGFIVPVGAVDEIVEKICFLYANRRVLETMGRKAYETIKENNNKSELIKLWESLLV